MDREMREKLDQVIADSPINRLAAQPIYREPSMLELLLVLPVVAGATAIAGVCRGIEILCGKEG